MSESNGYAKASDFEGQPERVRVKDEVVDGHKFKLLSWTSLESSRWRLKNLDDPETTNERAIIIGCGNPEGPGRLFGEKHIPMLQGMDAGFISRLADACVIHAGEVIESKKNSDETTSDDSPTD